MNWKSFIVSMLIGSFAFLPLAVGNGERSPASIDPSIVTQIKRLQPSLKPIDQKRLAKALRDTAKKCGIPWEILLSIAFHESGLNRHAVNHKTHDYGLTQINEKMILTLGLDPRRLVEDERYALEAACRILEENRTKHSGQVTYWLGMYRSGIAVWKYAVRHNAISYDRMIRSTAAEMGYEAKK